MSNLTREQLLASLKPLEWEDYGSKPQSEAEFILGGLLLGFDGTRWAVLCSGHVVAVGATKQEAQQDASVWVKSSVLSLFNLAPETEETNGKECF